MKRHITIATRKSPLALSQAEIVKAALMAAHPHLSVDLLGLTTTADEHLNIMLTEIGGKGLFVKELEEALLDGRADIAVHSMKDVPMELPPGLVIPVILKRADPRDVLISNDYTSFATLPHCARVGTSSLRRQNQLRALRGDIEFHQLRGNIQTRLRRLDEGDFAAIVLAAAGLMRMQLNQRITTYFNVQEILPAAGQGAIGVECREGDETIHSLISSINDLTTFQCVSAERAVCRRLGGGCKVPLASYADYHRDSLTIRARVVGVKSMQIVYAERSGKLVQAETLGLRVAEELISLGAQQILGEA